MLLVRQLRHGFTKKANASPNLTVAHVKHIILYSNTALVGMFVAVIKKLEYESDVSGGLCYISQKLQCRL